MVGAPEMLPEVFHDAEQALQSQFGVRAQMAEIGRANNVGVSDQELANAIMAEARNYPGQEKMVLDFYRQNPNAAAQMRAPIYEEKVVDLIVGVADVTDKPITKEELLKEDEEG